MTEVGNVYGESLYELAKEEALSQTICQQLAALQQSFRQEPDFLRLLGTPSLTKAERCQILDDSFRGKLHPYVLNFLKIRGSFGTVGNDRLTDRRFPYLTLLKTGAGGGWGSTDGYITEETIE